MAAARRKGKPGKEPMDEQDTGREEHSPLSQSDAARHADADHCARNRPAFTPRTSVYAERRRNFVGQHFWARGYFVSTVGRDEALIREYIRNQEQEDERLDQLGLWR
jgi:REP element-mobilizing transposase RayT